MYDPYADFQSVKLPNGLWVHVLHRPELTFARFELVVLAGKVNDPTGKAGVSHFLEHMVCANSGKTLPEMQRYFAREGGSFGAVTNDYRTAYGFMAPLSSSKFYEFVDFWVQALLVTKIDNFFEREQKIIRSEIARDFPSITTMEARQKIVQLVFRSLPEGVAQSALGTVDSFEGINLDDLRAYKKQRYTPQNMHLVCAGGLSLDALLRRLADTPLVDSYEGTVRALPKSLDVVPKPEQLRFEADFSEGACMGVASIHKTIMLPSSVSLQQAELFARMLSEMLMQQLREERGLVYNAGARIDRGFGFHMLSVNATDFTASDIAAVESVMNDTLFSAVESASETFDEVSHEQSVDYLVYDPTIAGVHRSAATDLVMQGRIIPLTEEQKLYAEVTYPSMVALRPYLKSENIFTHVELK